MRGHESIGCLAEYSAAISSAAQRRFFRRSSFLIRNKDKAIVLIDFAGMARADSPDHGIGDFTGTFFRERIGNRVKYVLVTITSGNEADLAFPLGHRLEHLNGLRTTIIGNEQALLKQKSARDVHPLCDGAGRTIGSRQGDFSMRVFMDQLVVIPVQARLLLIEHAPV